MPFPPTLFLLAQSRQLVGDHLKGLGEDNSTGACGTLTGFYTDPQTEYKILTSNILRGNVPGNEL